MRRRNMVVYGNEPMIWFERDDDRTLLLNLRMLTHLAFHAPACRTMIGSYGEDPSEVESPPNGSRLLVRYENGDEFRLRFRECGFCSGA